MTPPTPTPTDRRLQRRLQRRRRRLQPTADARAVLVAECPRTLVQVVAQCLRVELVAECQILVQVVAESLRAALTTKRSRRALTREHYRKLLE